jgi:Asp/Glu/hydantoin racemase
MTRKVALIHTVGSLAPVFDGLVREALPDVETSDTVDERLLEETIAAGRIPDAVARRLEGHVDRAVRDGADLVLVTCSSMGPVVEAITARSEVPVLRVDEAMADAALAVGGRIGVIATLATTLEPTADVVRRRAAESGRSAGAVEIVRRLVEGAFAELKAGNLERHDELVRAGLRELLPRVDVVVLAQASMARVAGQLTADDTMGKPILASPRLAVERVAERLGRPRVEAGDGG